MAIPTNIELKEKLYFWLKKFVDGTISENGEFPSQLQYNTIERMNEEYGGSTVEKKEIYEYVIKDSDLDLDNTLFIDNQIENVEAARKAGIKSILFKSLEQLKKELTSQPSKNFNNKQIKILT